MKCMRCGKEIDKHYVINNEKFEICASCIKIMQIKKDVKIVKGKFKGIKGTIYLDEYMLRTPKITVFTDNGSEYWVDKNDVRAVEE